MTQAECAFSEATHLFLDISSKAARNATAISGFSLLRDSRFAMSTRTDSTNEFHLQLRGLFALLRTLVRQTTAGRHCVEDYAQRLEGRIGSLARVHDMLMRAPVEGLDLQELVSSELIAHAIAHARYQVDGPEIRMSRAAAAALTLVLHELTMNACEHGALSNGQGSLEVSWNRCLQGETDCLRLDWRERGSLTDSEVPINPGFGWELIQRLLPYELGARSEFQRNAAGIHWTLLFPALATNTVWRAAT